MGKGDLGRVKVTGKREHRHRTKICRKTSVQLLQGTKEKKKRLVL